MTTHISWTDETWNPATGCTKVSAGCDHCYIDRQTPLRIAHRKFDKPGVGGTTGVLLHPERLDRPFHWREARRVFVNSMSDLFHDDIPDDHIAKTFAVMALTSRHTYQILTKRPARMRSLLNSGAFTSSVADAAYLMSSGENPNVAQKPARAAYAGLAVLSGAVYARQIPWPLPNVWLGVSTENQKWADIRIPLLLETPAAVRFISAEPLLGFVELNAMYPLVATDAVAGIDWVIVGGESGPGARTMYSAWAERLRVECAAYGIAFHFKQYGTGAAKALGLKHRAGGDPNEWPTTWPREYPGGAA